METAQEHPLFKLPPVSLNQIEKFLHISFRTVEHFSDSKPDPQKGENWTLGAVRTSPGGRPGGGEDGQAWN